MAESTLSLTRAQLRSEVGDYLGYGTDSANWTAGQDADIVRAVNSGLRRFYFPLVNGQTYEWSFMKINATIVTVASDYDQDLTEAFAGIEGYLTYSTTDNASGPVEIIPEVDIRAMREASDGATGRPRFAAIRAKSHAGTSTGQLWEIIFYPTPDAVYTLTYRGTVSPDAVSASIIYPYGGLRHAETIKECCLWAAEEMFDDEHDGVHKRAAQERLIASMDGERNALAPEQYGYNGDNSDNIQRMRTAFPHTYANNITRNGVSYY